MEAKQLLPPKHGKLYLCRYGFNSGQQVCLFVGHQGDGYLVRKWRKNSGRWTAAVGIAKRDILRAATRDDCKRASVDMTRLQP